MFKSTNTFDRSVIVIYLDYGNDSFVNHTTYSTASHAQPKSIYVADFDNDASSVLVFTKNGDGSFAAPIEIRIGYGAHPFSVWLSVTITMTRSWILQWRMMDMTISKSACRLDNFYYWIEDCSK